MDSNSDVRTVSVCHIVFCVSEAPLSYELATKESVGVAPLSPPVKPNYFLTTTLQVLLVIAFDPSIRMKEIATELRVTERAVQRIVEDLTSQGYLAIRKSGRRNSYVINHQSILLKVRASTVSLGLFLELLLNSDNTTPAVTATDIPSGVQLADDPVSEVQPNARGSIPFV